MKQVGTLVAALLSMPQSWMALLIIAALEWAFIKWFQPSLVMKAIALGMGFALLLLWPILLNRSGTLGQLYLRMASEAKTEEIQELKLLESHLTALQCVQGVEQLGQLRKKLDTVTDVLKRRLYGGELTFGRYLQAAERVYASAIDNLRNAAVSLRSVSTIDPVYINKCLTELYKMSSPTDEQKREIHALEKRRALLDQQLKRVASLISQNELAMTVLDNASIALADTRTGKGGVSIDPETAMAELEMLAKRAGKYAAPPQSGI